MSKSESSLSEGTTELSATSAQVEPSDAPSFGWNAYSELMNGRFAMLAIVGLLLLEGFTNQDLFTWLGLR